MHKNDDSEFQDVSMKPYGDYMLKLIYLWIFMVFLETMLLQVYAINQDFISLTGISSVRL